MPRQVQGYQAIDGQFFETETEAELHEAIVELTLVMTEAGLTAKAIEQVFGLVRNVMPQFRRYIDAVEAQNNQEDAALNQVRERGGEVGDDDAPDAGEHQTDYRQELASLQQQPVGGYELVSNVGRRERAEEVQTERTIDGLGSWRDDASDVRRR